jgi:hypothetical protein
MMDADGPIGCLFPFEWPRASFRKWVIGLGSFVILLAICYGILAGLEVNA